MEEEVEGDEWMVSTVEKEEVRESEGGRREKTV